MEYLANFMSEVSVNALGGLIAGLVLFLLPVLIFDEKKIIRPWLNNLSGVARWIVWLVLWLKHLILHAYTRVIIITLFSSMLLAGANEPYGLIYLGGIVILALTLAVWPKSAYPTPTRSSSFFSDFTNIDKWEIFTGKPTVESDFGNPKPPDLLLSKDSTSATNTLILLKDTEVEKGVIECDYYLEPEGILNIIVFASGKRHNWYMARYDSRDRENDGILVKDAGPGANWRSDSIGYSGNSPKRRWHKARVEFSSEKISMFRNDELIAEVTRPQLLGKEVGLFNEVNDVHVDNLTIGRL